MPAEADPPALVEHFFRHECGRVVASLVRSFGAGRLGLIEESVQSALTLALTSWSLNGVPDRPGAWLTRVARNGLIDQLRRGGAEERALASSALESQTAATEPVEVESDARFRGEIDDDFLRMLFVCCDDKLAPRTQLVLALKILCGFSASEIARRLLSTEAAVNKRLSRGREQLREQGRNLDTPDTERLTARLSAVHQVLYLLFNEGYSSARPEQPIRRELCEEALRLTRLLVADPVGDQPQSWALLSIMHLHHGRLDARTDAQGSLLLMEEQDRTRWDQEHIRLGLGCLARSSSGNVFSRYHAEAGVLAEHCSVASYEQTRWNEIVDLYAMLEKIAPSPLHTLNRAIALAEWKSPEVGLGVLLESTPPAWLARYYLWDATLGELYRRSGELERAREHLASALDAAPTDAEKRRIRARLKACDGSLGRKWH